MPGGWHPDCVLTMQLPVTELQQTAVGRVCGQVLEPGSYHLTQPNCVIPSSSGGKELSKSAAYPPVGLIALQK